jgi:hypothetical protein
MRGGRYGAATGEAGQRASEALLVMFSCTCNSNMRDHSSKHDDRSKKQLKLKLIAICIAFTVSAMVVSRFHKVIVTVLKLPTSAKLQIVA